MDGNSTYRHTSTVDAVDRGRPKPRVVVTSTEFDAQPGPHLRAGRVRAGLLEGLAGIHERRWWPEGMTFADGAAQAGAKAIAQSGVDPYRIGLMINSSVSRAYLEPSTAVEIHHRLGLPTSCDELRPGQRLPGLRQRHPPGRDHDRRRPHRLRTHRRRRGRASGPGEHHCADSAQPTPPPKTS